ncbi:MAG: hypothetical protein N4A38_00560 [Candidatus Gracilibacteria bacterium]|nr:hypothetical protein [Candidatus Gracilibacteria bacterium]
MTESKKINNEWILTILIWLFGGMFGLHRILNGKLSSGLGMGFLFYIGHFLKIILIGYLLIPIFWIIWFIDGFLILTSQFTNTKGEEINMYQK